VAGPVYNPDGSAATRPDGSAVTQPIDGTRTRGFELEASGRLGHDVQGSFGWTRYLTKDGDGKTIRTFIPSTLVRLFATWEPKGLVRGLSLGGGVNWQSATVTQVGSPAGGADFRQPSLAQVSLMARYQFSPNLSLQFNGNNVLDKKYFVLDQYSNSYYGAPANYSLTLRATY
jgi:outer membrane receptor for ferric coprogen and ferric-rhodotorulic acid